LIVFLIKGNILKIHNLDENKKTLEVFEMKSKITILILVLFLVSISIFSQDVVVDDDFSSLGEWKVINGDWKVNSDGQLVQLDTEEKMTNVYRKVDQSGVIQYEFGMGYLEGLDDQYGGVGIHILIDQPNEGRAWGHGESHLLWLTYDFLEYNKAKIFAQLYKSTGPTSMKIIHTATAYPCPSDKLSTSYFENITGKTISIKIIIDTTSGIIKAYHPFKANYYYEVKLGKSFPVGSYLSFRTNSLSVLIDDFKVSVY